MSPSRLKTRRPVAREYQALLAITIGSVRIPFAMSAKSLKTCARNVNVECCSYLVNVFENALLCSIWILSKAKNVSSVIGLAKIVSDRRKKTASGAHTRRRDKGRSAFRNVAKVIT